MVRLSVLARAWPRRFADRHARLGHIRCGRAVSWPTISVNVMDTIGYQFRVEIVTAEMTPLPRSGLSQMTALVLP